MRLPRLEVFDTDKPLRGGGQVITTELAAFEEEKLAAYDQGFRAGWDDAVAAQSDDIARLRTDLGRNLQALAFTYQEARTHLLAGLEPLLTEMVNRLLPEMAREALAAVVLDRLMPMAGVLADRPVTLVLHPAARPAVETMLTRATGLPLAITEESTLAEGQVYLRLGTSEAKVDLTRATAEITAAVHAFFTLTQEPETHGRPE